MSCARVAARRPRASRALRGAFGAAPGSRLVARTARSRAGGKWPAAGSRRSCPHRAGCRCRSFPTAPSRCRGPSRDRVRCLRPRPGGEERLEHRAAVLGSNARPVVRYAQARVEAGTDSRAPRRAPPSPGAAPGPRRARRRDRPMACAALVARFMTTCWISGVVRAHRGRLRIQMRADLERGRKRGAQELQRVGHGPVRRIGFRSVARGG